MFFPSSALLLALLSTLIPSTYASPDSPTTTTDLPSDLKILLAQADRVRLHAALHESHSSFTDGTHENDFAAIEAIHRESPPLATKILELARRQNSNSTMTTAAPAATSESSNDILFTTYTDNSGHLVTVSYTSVVAVGAATNAAANGGSSGPKASATAAGTLQNAGENVQLGYQAVVLGLLVGLVGLA